MSNDLKWYVGAFIVTIAIIVWSLHAGLSVPHKIQGVTMNPDDQSVEVSPGVHAPPINSIPLYQYETEFDVYPDAWSKDNVRMKAHITFGYTLQSRDQLKQLIAKYGYTWYADLAFDHYGKIMDSFMATYTAKDLIYGRYPVIQGTDIIQTRNVDFHMYDRRAQEAKYPGTYIDWS